MLSFDQALKTILSEVGPADAELCELQFSHLRVLASDISSPSDVPPFDNSSMDGYAVRSDDTRHAGPDHAVELNINGTVGAGDTSAAVLNSGSACRILTGAAIPPGADSVIEQERVDVAGNKLRLHAPVDRGRNLRRRGEDIRNGQTVLAQGTRISAARLGVLASVGVPRVKVFPVPRIGILTTGNELTDVGEPLEYGKIRDSNSYTLASLVRESGCTPVPIVRALDTSTDLLAKLKSGLLNDALITSGGVSVGDRDLVLETLKELGVEILFWKVNIKPGMPFAFGLFRKGEGARPVPVFALPGNPVSTMVTFLQFVRPALARILGLSGEVAPVRLLAKLEEDYEKTDGKRHFARGIARNEKGELLVRKSGSQSSGVLASMSVANCLMIIPEHVLTVRAGSMVEIELMGNYPWI